MHLKTYASYWYTSQFNLNPDDSMPFQIMEFIIATFGLFGNIALLVTYFRKDRKIRFNNLMMLIGAFDVLFVLLALVGATSNLAFTITPTSITNQLRKWYNFTSLWSFSGSVYVTALIAIERFLAICKER